MKIKWGMMMTDGRGKLGGQVASKNRAGAYVRTKVTPTNPRTSAQMAVRYAFAVVTKAWSSLLTNTERELWNESADSGMWNKTDIFGDAKRPTGKNLFTSINRGLQEAGFPLTSQVPPKAEFPEIVLDGTVWQLEATVTFNGSLPVLAGDSAYVVYATPPLSAGTSYFENKLRKILTIPAGGAPEAYFDAQFASSYVAVFGAPAVGDNIFFGAKAIIDGQISPLVTSSVSVADPG